MNILTSYHPALLALQSLHDQFPAAIEFYLFCNDGGVKTYYSKGKNKGIFLPKEIGSAENKLYVQKLRKTKKEVFWTDKADLPIDDLGVSKKKYEIKQLTLQDEIEQSVLLFRIPGRNDDAYDVFAICFSKTFSNFYIPAGRNVLSSELKKSIGKTIRNQIVWLYDLHENQHRNINRIQNAYQQNADNVEELELELEREKATNRDLLGKYIDQLIREQEIALNCKIELKSGFLDKIKNTSVAIELLKEIVREATLTAYDLSVEKTVISLTPNLIQLEKLERKPIAKTVQLIELDKTQVLLDRYEKAARQLEQKSERINGRNLAKEMGISGPAITDAIKKHSSKIKRLLEKYPTNWPLICDFIRPIREMKWNLAVN